MTNHNYHSILTHLQEINIKKPSDIIIEQIKKLITTGVLKPGDKLPSERSLQESFKIGRGYVREAIKKLEFYGIVTTLPQSGTIVSNLGVTALEGLITNVLNLEKDDFTSLLETRRLLEIEVTRLTTKHATDEEIKELEDAQVDFYNKISNNLPGLDEDLLIHLKIAQFCRNSVLRSLVSLITPDVILFSKELKTCDNGRFKKAYEEHELILKAIKSRDPDIAAKAMENHLNRTLQVTNKAYSSN